MTFDLTRGGPVPIRSPQWVRFDQQKWRYLTTLVKSRQAGEGSGVWAMEQPIGFLNISVNIRMTVLRLADGSLLVLSWSRPRDTHPSVSNTQSRVSNTHPSGFNTHIRVSNTHSECV